MLEATDGPANALPSAVTAGRVQLDMGMGGTLDTK